MTKTIDIKAIIIAYIAAAAIVLLALAAHHHSVSVSQVQVWKSDTTWTGGWNNFSKNAVE